MNNPLKSIPSKPESGDWRESAVCASTDPDIFYPGSGRPGRLQKSNPEVRLAVALCETCPVIQECRNYAITNGETYGVWGGLSENELSAIARRHRQRAA